MGYWGNRKISKLRFGIGMILYACAFANSVIVHDSLSRTCMVTSLSSTCTSLVRKSAPIVALYWLENFLFTYWFMRDVFPTLHAEASEVGWLALKATDTE